MDKMTFKIATTFGYNKVAREVWTVSEIRDVAKIAKIMPDFMAVLVETSTIVNNAFFKEIVEG